MATSLPTRHPGNLAVRHFRGASRTVRHGETVNPPAIERAGPETPHYSGARSISIPTAVTRCIALYAETTASLPGAHWRRNAGGGRTRVTNTNQGIRVAAVGVQLDM